MGRVKDYSEATALLIDQEIRKLIDSALVRARLFLSENKDKLPAADVAAAEGAFEATRKALQEGGREAIETAAAELTKAAHKVAEALYKQASAGSPGSGPGEPPPPAGEGAGKGGDGDVIDAEVVDKK